MDQNWYTQDLSPRPPKKTSFLWLWILGGCFIFFGLIAAAVVLVVSQIPDGKGFDEWLADSVSTDDSQIIEFRNSAAVARLESAKAAYTENQTSSADVSADEVAAIETFLLELTTVLRDGEDAGFEAKASVLEFKDRVRQAPSLSFTARREFRSQFDDWYTMYGPYSGSVSRIQLASVKRDPADHALIAYTWVFSSRYPDRVAWYLRSNGQDLRIVDYEILDTSTLASDDSARQFSAAFTGTPWDNHLVVHQYTPEDVTSAEGIAAAKSEVLRQSRLTFPKSIAQWAWYRLAQTAMSIDDKDLCLEMLARTEELAPLPCVYWQRAVIFQELKDYAKAESNLRQYTDLIGPGPECFLLEAEIATALKQYERANLAWVRLMTLDPGVESLPWNFHSHMPAAVGTLLAESIQSREDRALAAQKIASLLVTRERFDLAEPLLPIAESGNNQTPELFVLRAEIAQINESHDEYASNLEQAWKTASAENPSRANWIYKWASELSAHDRGAEAIARSPDPGHTFYDLAIDEDGYLILNSKQLQQLSDALQQTTTDDESAAKWLKVWRHLAPVTVVVKQSDWPSVWNSLSELLSKDASDEDRHVSELLTELELTWIVQDWLSTAAIETKHVTEAWELLPEDDRLSTLVWKIDDEDSIAGLNEIIDKLRANNTAERDLVYCEGLAAELKKDFPTAIQKYCEFMQRSDFEESPFEYRVKNSLVEILIDQTDWETRIADLPADMLLRSLASRMISENRLNDAQTVLEIARKKGATLAETVPTEARILTARKDWPALCILCERWLAERNPEEDSNRFDPYGRHNVSRLFFDAWIATQQLDRAETFLSQQPRDQYYIPEWKLKLAVARNDQQAAEAVFANLEEDSGTAPDIAGLGATSDAVWSEAWRDFRRRHPIGLYSIGSNSSAESHAVLLQSSAMSITADTLRERLQTVQSTIAIDDLTTELTETEESAIFRLSSTNVPRDEVTRLKVGTRQLFRATVDGSSYLLFVGTDQYHKPIGADDHVDDESPPESLKQAIDNHRAWICLKSEPSTITRDAKSMKSQFSTILAALLDDQTMIVNMAAGTTPMSAALKTALASGNAEDLPAMTSYALSGVEPLMTAMTVARSKRLRALRDRLKKLQVDTEVPKIRLVLAMPGLWQRDQISIECPLKKWEPQAYPTRFIVDLGDSLFVPPAFRGEFAEAGEWSVLDWREE